MMRSRYSRPAAGHRGFTLLEVLVAMTITGLALGALLGVIGGNKRLAWKSEEALAEATRLRARINFAQLNDGRGEVSPDWHDDGPELLDDIELETPERKTSAMTPALRGYRLETPGGEILASGTYWVELALPE